MLREGDDAIRQRLIEQALVEVGKEELPLGRYFGRRAPRV
jgi:hypothetical protein